MAETTMGELAVWPKQLWIVFGSVAETTESELATTRLREYFGNGKFDDGSLVRNKSTFTPKTGRDEYLDSFIDTISKLPINYHNTKQNLSRREKKSLEELKNNPSIILKEADKGGGIVIMDKTFYREKVLEQLNDNEYYTKLRKNNDKSTIRKIKKLVKEYSESFTDNEIAYLCDFTPKEANFYGLPKIHKSNTIQTAVKHQNRKYIESPNPNDLKLRPIVAGPESTTQRMSHFLDLILKKLCPLIPSYVRDDIDFLRYIPETVPKNTLLTTFDVTSLYTNIPHDLGTTAIKYWVEINREIVDGRFDTELIVSFGKCVLQSGIGCGTQNPCSSPDGSMITTCHFNLVILHRNCSMFFLTFTVRVILSPTVLPIKRKQWMKSKHG
ncbi:unnamed protein product [Mytilus edulis]|uniref:Reverse transcriptase domain-containing protein n=1 Tax=Mytilus edulis TaxID=6550 RepID=A0A8S3S1C0_MYTED|nr:unnamed protein product [Mytilus edulis]